MIKKILQRNLFFSKSIESYLFYKYFLTKKGWIISRFHKESLDQDSNPIPWFTYSSLTFIESRIENRFEVFEFGSGNSTFWFSERVSSITSVESNATYYKKIKSTKRKNIKIYNLDESNYADKILEYKNEFDIIIIDGIKRNHCIKNSISALKVNGVIILDNSEREEYLKGKVFLCTNGFKELPFSGIGPNSFNEWTTSIFYKEINCLGI